MIHLIMSLELDALALEEEDEGPSYIADLNKAPDFLDEEPVVDVSLSVLLPVHNLIPWTRRRGKKRLERHTESSSLHRIGHSLLS